jgi:hypothetical protein
MAGRVVILAAEEDNHQKLKADLDRETIKQQSATRRERKRAGKLAAAAAALRDNNSE